MLLNRVAGSIILLVVFVDGLMGQNTVLTGIVADLSTGEPISAVNVSVYSQAEQAFGAVTNDEGKYEVVGLASGTYRVVMTHVSYDPLEFTDVVLADDRPNVLNAQMQLAILRQSEIVVESVSRGPEKVLEAPASVSVLEGDELSLRPVTSFASHVRTAPAANIIQTGLVQNRVAVRGFNGVIAGSDQSLLLTDFRNAQVPSLRISAHQLVPPVNEDVDRIEVVSGPASALYGPNAAQGLVHIISRSPFDDPSTTINAGFGEQNVFQGAFRHADKVSDAFAYKISGHYTRGDDWEYNDPAEPDSIVKGKATPEGREPLGSAVPNNRNFDVENFSADTRLEFRPTPDVNVVAAGGFAQTTNLNITTLGAAQQTDFGYKYLQGLLFYKGLFLQASASEAGLGNDDTYILRTGDLIVDKSRLFVLEVQHRVRPHTGLELTYGADANLTRPRTEFTISGRNEEDDDINEIGVYFHADAAVSPQFRLIGAVRIDDHNLLNNPVISPRAAVVFKPHPSHSVRVTYNRAYTTPSSSAFFLDVNIAPSLGPLPFPLRGLGVPKTGFSFSRGAGGGVGDFFMQSPFNSDVGEYIPADATLMWGAVVNILAMQGVDLSALPPPSSGEVETALKILNAATFEFDPIDPGEVSDIAPLEPTITNTLEVGYKGPIGHSVYFAIDGYYTQIENLATNVDLQTPNVFFDEASLSGYLAQFMPAEDAAALSAGIAGIPLGTLTPSEAGATNPANLIFTTRNFRGDVSLFGIDVKTSIFATEHVRFHATYSYVSDNFFEKGGEQVQDLAMNAPKHKGNVRFEYDDRHAGVNGQIRIRHSGEFEVLSGVYAGTVDAYTVVDANVSYELPFSRSTRVMLSVENLFDNAHREFVGTPEIGRLTLVQLSHTL